MSLHTVSHRHNVPPAAFTQAELEWLPWLEPLPEAELTDRHRAGLVDAARAKSPYFMLLARDPDILGARTRTDKDIFYNPDAGLPRAERELSAAATSRYNGCIYCASVHARFATHFSPRSADIQRLLDEGVHATLDPRWDAIVAVSTALSSTPITFGSAQVDALRSVGLDELAIADVIHGAAFFNWANRLMLSLGEPKGPAAAAVPTVPPPRAVVAGPSATATPRASSAFLQVQVDAERRAIELIARSDVRAALGALAAKWRDGTPGRLPETYDRLQASIEEVLFMVALEVINDDPRRPEVVEISAGPHRWGGLDVPGGRWGINNPDTLYFAVPVESGSAYVVKGRRLADGPVDTNFSIQVRDVWATLDNLGTRDLAIDAQGRYQMTVDDRPADGRPHHLQIKEHGTVLVIRQTLADWSKARPDTLTVERTRGPSPLPLRSEDELARALIERLGDVVTHNVDTLQAPIFRQPANTIPQPGEPGDKSGYLVTQRNALGHFRLDDGEALIAVFHPGGAGYAAFTATDIWGVTPDSARHQHSLNHRQAALDADGTFTLVVSNRDPGIFNWIDPGGLREGLLMLRWQLLDEHPAKAGGPAISLRRVRQDELHSALPAGVRRVSEGERRLQIEARGAAYARRFSGR